MSGSATYIHGDGLAEQERLLRQAVTLEPFLHRNITFAAGSTVLEIGCGVGAQLRLLASKHSHTRFHGVDTCDANVAASQRHLKPHIESGQVSITKGNGGDLPFADGTFDAAVTFFVLEHVADPLAVIREAHRVLKPGGEFIATEVINVNLSCFPPSRPIAEHWSAFNDFHRTAGGDPDIGIKLGGLLHRAGFQDIELNDASVMFDERMQDMEARAALVENWVAVFLSVADQLVARGMAAAGIEQSLRNEFTRYLHDPQSVFMYPARQARGRKETQREL